MGIVDEFKELKAETDADLLAMQVGDFYEFFGEDAKITSRELGLKISQKSSHGSSHAMAGVPINDLDDYIETLVSSKNYTVAIADQFEEQGNHKREIERVVTPGTLVANTTGSVRYLATVYIGSDTAGIALTDLNSGRILTREIDNDDIVDELAVYDPVEVVVSYEDYESESIVESTSEQIENYLNSRVILDNVVTERADLEALFKNEFGEESHISIGIKESELAMCSVGRMIQYLEETKTDVSRTISKVREIGDEEYMKIDARTRYSLEISETMGQNSGSSLFDVIDKTVTTNGQEKLQKYIQRPLVAREKILRRQRSVSAMISEGLARKEIREKLEAMPNLQRIASKCAYGTATPRDLKNISKAYDSYNNLLDIFENNQTIAESPLYEDISGLKSDDLKKIRNLVDSAITDDAPNSVEEGIIKPGFDDELDHVVEEHQEYKDWFDNYKQEIADEHDLSHLTIGRNKTDGFYLQIGNSENDQIPDSLNQIKNLKNSFRYKNDLIREKERDILRLEEKREDLEQQIFEDILSQVTDSSDVLQEFGEVVSHIDAVQSLATHAVRNKWAKPDIKRMGRGINIGNGRHPVVEQETEFVPNDIVFDDSNTFYIVTGPNMAGKSTYLRQIALICILAQTGSYVPCEKAEIGIVDSVFARVGSVDEISEGRSTFMVEMSELANILHSSTDDSLVILDEVGRGTATFDGVSIAKSTIEYLAGDNNHPQPFTLFATHYHELTGLANSMGKVQNLHLPIKSTGNGHKFTHKVRDGAASKSYGIQVADMAGVPQPVIDRSKDILEDLKDENN